MPKIHHKDSNIPNGITNVEIRKAVQDYNDAEIEHRFINSTTFDVIIDGNRYPPKAIIGLASRHITGEVLTPAHFSAGHGKKCFKLLEENGFPIVLKSDAIVYPDDVQEAHYEGAVSKVTVNRYERDDTARAKCIEHYGLNCSVCNFNFGKAYGELGAGFIHVHHLTLISSIRKEYQVDPIKDLRPVCPNCHSMLHKRRPEPYSIEELKKLMK
jgi:5-methylcytosine-specific restriction protein A